MRTPIVTCFACVLLISPSILLNQNFKNIGHFAPLGEASQGNNSGAGIFEEYDETKNLKQKLERLDGFALYLNLNPSFRAYIISYGGLRSCRGEALMRARFTKHYLSKVKDIDKKRITIMDGGYRDKWTVQLWFGAKGEVAPTSLPTVDRRDVKIIKKCTSKSSSCKTIS